MIDIFELITATGLQSAVPERATQAQFGNAAMAQAGKPTGFCGQKWLGTNNPICIVCNGTGGIASASRCPECEK